jgi:RHS repeat-associated protein
MIANPVGTPVWRWDQGEPFGDSVPNDDPNNTGNHFDFPQRFPGQYFDRETGLAQNGFRDYWSGGGRYAESDLIGLRGGLNTYDYVRSDPLQFTDPDGLFDPTGFTGVLTGTATGTGTLIGGIVGGAILALIPNTVDDEDSEDSPSRTIPQPEKPSCGCTCICRADADDRIPGNVKPNRPKFAFGQATADNCAKASKEANRIATKNLGMQPKHIPCKCAGS